MYSPQFVTFRTRSCAEIELATNEPTATEHAKLYILLVIFMMSIFPLSITFIYILRLDLLELTELSRLIYLKIK